MPKVKARMGFVGIDPGATGGIVALFADGSRSITKMPETDKDLWIWLDSFPKQEDYFAVIEKVGGFIKGNPAPGSAMFNFGVGYGALRMALTAARIPFEEVPPQRWQKALNIPTRKKNETKTQFKKRLKVKAQQLFPNVEVTNSTADALLIALYCKRKHEGTL